MKNRDYEKLSQDLRELKHAKKLLEARIDGLEEEFIYALKRKISIPYFSLERANGKLIWKKQIADDIIYICILYGFDVLKPAEFFTPVQAINGGVPRELILDRCEKTAGALKLVEQTSINIKRLFKK